MHRNSDIPLVRSRRDGPGGAPSERWRRVAAVLLPFIALALLAMAAVPALGKTVPFFFGSASQEAVLSDMTTHPAAVRSGSKTWIAFQGPGYDPYVAEWDSATRSWIGPFRIGSNPLQLDAHGAPALWLDPATGKLHVFWAGHMSAMQHAVTARPGVVSDWTALPDVSPYATYPEAVTLTDGSLLLFYRDSATAWVSRASTNGVTFASPKTVLRSDSHTAWYADFRSGAAGRVNGTFVRVDLDQYNKGRRFDRYDLFYVRRQTDGTWHTADGSALPTCPWCRTRPRTPWRRPLRTGAASTRRVAACSTRCRCARTTRAPPASSVSSKRVPPSPSSPGVSGAGRAPPGTRRTSHRRTTSSMRAPSCRVRQARWRRHS